MKTFQGRLSSFQWDSSPQPVESAKIGYAREPWAEHFEWLEPMFNERLEIRNARMIVPNRPGLGFSLSEQATAWTAEQVEFGKRA